MEPMNSSSSSGMITMTSGSAAAPNHSEQTRAFDEPVSSSIDDTNARQQLPPQPPNIPSGHLPLTTKTVTTSAVLSGVRREPSVSRPLSQAPRFSSSASLLTLTQGQQYHHHHDQQQQQPTLASCYNSKPIEQLRTLDVHTVLRGRKDPTEGFISGEKGSIDIRPLLTKEDYETRDAKTELVAKCCSVGASVSMDDAFDRPQSVFSVKNKRQQKEITMMLQGGGGGSSASTSSIAAGVAAAPSTMMNMTSAMLGSGTGYHHHHHHHPGTSGGGGASAINFAANLGGHFGPSVGGGVGGAVGGGGAGGGGGSALNRKHLRADKWRWVLHRFQHNCQKCGGPAVDYVLVVTTHTNTSSPRVAAVLFSDSFPCINDVHRHFAETHDIFRKQEALLLDHQGKIASLISHTDMFLSFDVMKLRDDVIAPYWIQLLATRNLRTPCQFNEANLQALQHLSPATDRISATATSTVMSPATILPPSTHDELVNPATSSKNNYNSNAISTSSSSGSPSTIHTTTTAPSLTNINNSNSNAGRLLVGAFPSTPAQTVNNISSNNNIRHNQQQQSSSTSTTATTTTLPLLQQNYSSFHQGGGPPHVLSSPQSLQQRQQQQQQQQQQQKGIDASIVYNSLQALHIILSYRSVVILGSNSSKTMIRGWLDFFRAVYDPSRVVLPEPIQIPAAAAVVGATAFGGVNAAMLRDTASTGGGGSSTMSGFLPNSAGLVNSAGSESGSTVSFQPHHQSQYYPISSSVPPTPIVNSTGNTASGNVDRVFISLFNQKKFNWLPLPHVAAQAFCSNSVEHDLVPALKKLADEDFERDPLQTPCVCIVEEGTGQLLIPHAQIYSSVEENSMVIEATETSRLMLTLRHILVDVRTEQQYRHMVSDGGRIAREKMLSTRIQQQQQQQQQQSSSSSSGGNTGGFFSNLFGSKSKNSISSKESQNTTQHQDPNNNSTTSISDLPVLSGLSNPTSANANANANNNNNANDTSSEVNSVSNMTVASTNYQQKALLSRKCCDSILFRSAMFWATWSRRYSHLPNKWDLMFMGLGSDRDAPYWMEKKKVALIESQLRM